MFFYILKNLLILHILSRGVSANILTSALLGIPRVAQLSYYNQPLNYYSSGPRMRSNQNSYMPQQVPQYFNQLPYYEPFQPQIPKFKPKPGKNKVESSEYSTCGYIPPRVTKYVANGEDTDNKLWPWYVQIVIAGNNKSESETFCGGTVISKNFVLTAAHCYDDLLPSKRSRNTVVLAKGIASDVKFRNGKKSDIIKIRAKEVILHPEYIPAMTESEARKKGVSPGPLNDLAIIELKHENSDVYDKLIPVCLPSDYYELKTNTQCKVMGHGFMSASDEDTFTMPNILQSANVRLSSNQDCRDGVESQAIKSKINSNTICIRGPVHPCVGDSGGPLICAGESSINIQGTDDLDDYESEMDPDEYEPRKQKWFLCGVTSFAVSTDENDRCGSYKSAVFGKVSNYVKWIKSFINE